LAGIVALGEMPRERASRWPSFLEGRLGPVSERPTVRPKMQEAVPEGLFGAILR